MSRGHRLNDPGRLPGRQPAEGVRGPRLHEGRRVLEGRDQGPGSGRIAEQAQPEGGDGPDVRLGIGEAPASAGAAAASPTRPMACTAR